MESVIHSHHLDVSLILNRLHVNRRVIPHSKGKIFRSCCMSIHFFLIYVEKYVTVEEYTKTFTNEINEQEIT